MPAPHLDTSRAYWRVVKGLPGSRSPGKQVLAGLALGTAKVAVESLPRGFGQLKSNWPAGLPLPDIGPLDGMAVGRHVIDT